MMTTMKSEKIIVDEKTMEALNASIDHWKEVVSKPLRTPVGAKNCALCDLFNNADECKGCPIYEYTGKTYCGGTSYLAFETTQEQLRKIYTDCTTSIAARLRACLRDLAIDMLKFLYDVRNACEVLKPDTDTRRVPGSVWRDRDNGEEWLLVACDNMYNLVSLRDGFAICQQHVSSSCSGYADDTCWRILVGEFNLDYKGNVKTDE